MTAPWRETMAEALCASRDITDPHHEAQNVPCGPCWRDADALAPMLARWLAEEREGIARAIEGHACNGSPESCDDALAGAPCPYDDAASIARNYRQENADG